MTFTGIHVACTYVCACTTIFYTQSAPKMLRKEKHEAIRFSCSAELFPVGMLFPYLYTNKWYNPCQLDDSPHTVTFPHPVELVMVYTGRSKYLLDTRVTYGIPFLTFTLPNFRLHPPCPIPYLPPALVQIP